MDEIAKPVPAPGQALVKIRAFGLNRMDLLQREGLYPLPPQAPATLGVEFSGIVEGFGGDAGDFKVGDEVFGLAYGGEFFFFGFVLCWFIFFAFASVVFPLYGCCLHFFKLFFLGLSDNCFTIVLTLFRGLSWDVGANLVQVLMRSTSWCRRRCWCISRSSFHGRRQRVCQR